MSLLKKIGFWFLLVLFAASALTYFPSFASLFAALIFALMLPVAKWKAFYGKYINGKWKTILIIVLAVLFFCTVPTTTDEATPDTTVPTITEATTEPTIETTEESIPETTVAMTEATIKTTTEATTAPTTPPVTTPPATTATTPPATEPPETTATTPPETQPAHTHNFSAATCSTPKTCSCGATDGSANGHAWQDATCTSPKTCTTCGETSGSNAGHNFSNGNCTTCGKEDPDYIRVTMVWIPTNGGKKYHTHAGCSGMEDPQQVTQSEAESLGFTPCKKCH